MKRYALFVLLLPLACGPAFAQPGEAGAAAQTNVPTLAPSLTAGYLSTDFAYGGDSLATPYDFGGSALALMLGGQRGSLLVSYYTREADSTGARPLRSLAADLWGGGDIYLFRTLLRLPLAAYVPVRFNMKYRYVGLEDSAGGGGAPSGSAEPPPLHLVGAGLGLGGGARFAFPFGPDLIRDNLVAQASYVVAPGVIGNVGDAFEEGFDEVALRENLSDYKMRRATSLNVEVQWKRLLGGAGVTAGYTLRTVARSEEKPGSFGDVVDAFIYGDEYVEIAEEHVFRIGINW